MGFLDDLSSTLSRGKDAAGRSSRTFKLNSQIREINRRRLKLVAQLGANIYEETKNNPYKSAEYPDLYEAIAACDAERQECQEKLAEIVKEKSAAKPSRSYRCAVCGTKMSSRDLFCSGCGTSAAEARPTPVSDEVIEETVTIEGESDLEAPENICPSCGSVVHADNVFCMNCGTKLLETAPEVQAELSMAKEALDAHGEDEV